MKKLMVLLSLTLGAALPASAQTLSAQSINVNPVQPVNTQPVSIDASIKFPPIVQTAASLINLLSQGVKVSFLTPSQQPAATLNPQGGIIVSPAAPRTSPITQVQVMTPIPGTTQVVQEIYPLAQPLDPRKPVNAQTIIVRASDGQRIPLTSVMGRQAAWAKAPGLQRKPGGMPPGQLKKLCNKDPRNALCQPQYSQPVQPKQQNNWHGNGKH